MAITVKHNKVSTVPDSADTSLVRPSDWNADHTLTGVGTMAEQNANNVNISGGSISGTTVSGYIPTTEKGANNGVATLDAGGKVPTSQIPLQGDLNYQGTWNASTNTPTLTSSVGTKGYYYVVDVAGTTNLNGITDWQIGDWAIFNGSVWQKVDNTDAVTSVNGQVGTVVLTAADVGAQPAGTYVTSVSATSPVTSTGGTTPTIAMPAANSTTNGYLTSTDWNTFNNISTGGVVGPASATDNAIARFDTTTGKLIQNSVVTVSDTGGIAGATTITDINYVDFNTAYATTLGAGQLGWDGNNTLGIGMSGGNIVQEIGLQTFIYGKATSAITKGQLIKKTGANGSSGVVTFAPTTANMTNSGDVIGIAAEDIALNGFGYIMSTGNLRGFNTTGSSSGETWADGDTLYYNPAGNGLMTKVKPSAPNIKTEVGIVTNAGSGGSGSVVVEIIHGSQLGGTDSNVQITSVTGGQLLSYDQTNGYWKNTNLSAGTGITVNSATGGTITVTNAGVTQATAGTGISVSAGTGNVTITNTAPDQTVAISAGTGISVSGTYPNFTVTNTSPSSGGTVTSVGGTGTVNGITLSGTVTSSGNLTLGGTLSGVSLSTQVTGTLPIANGGTGATTRQDAMDALAGAVTSGQYLRGNGTDVVMSAIQAADVPTLNQNTTGTAANVTGVVAIANGGTGQTTATAAFNALNPMTTTGDIIYEASPTTAARLPIGSSGQVLTVSGGIPAWANASSSNITALGLYENSATISANYTIGSGNNAMSAGPITINTGVTVTVPTGSSWTIV